MQADHKTRWCRCAIALIALNLIASPAAAMRDPIIPITTAAGVEIWLVERHEVPVIAIHMGFLRGAVNDPPHKRGVANLLAAVLNDGPADLPLQRYRRALDSMSSSIGFSASLNYFRASLFSITDNLDATISLMQETLTSPRLDRATLMRERTGLLSGLRRDKENPQTQASRLWFKTAFANHPYASPSQGDAQSVATIIPDDLRAWFRDHAARDVVRIVIVGDINAERARRVVDQLLAPLSPHAVNAPLAIESPIISKEPIYQPRQQSQTVIRFGGKGLSRNDPDYIAAVAATYILGGGTLLSRLDQVLRIEQGLTYSVYAYLNPMPYGPIYFGGLETSAENTNRAIQQAMAEIHEIANDTIQADDLRLAKDYLIGSFALQFSSTREVAKQLLSLQLAGLDRHYLDRRRGLIEALTLDDVNRAAQRLYDQGNPLIVVLGPVPPTSSTPVAEPTNLQNTTNIESNPY